MYIKVRTSKAFTLLELIVVIFIITIVGALVFSSAIHKEEKKTEDLNPSTLPATFKKAFKGQGDVELLCIQKCTKCYVMQEGKVTPYDGGIKFGTNVEIYTLNSNDHLVQKDELGRLKDEKISFRFHLYPNGSTTQMIVSNDQGIYFLPSYFGKAKKVKDMDEAKELWIKSKYDLKDSSSFY